MVAVLEIIIIVFVLFAWSRVLLRYQGKLISVWEFLFWSAVWVGLIVVTLARDYLFFVSHILGIERPIDIVVYGSIILLFYLVFRIYIRIEELDQEITKVVREAALRRKKK